MSSSLSSMNTSGMTQTAVTEMLVERLIGQNARRFGGAADSVRSLAGELMPPASVVSNAPAMLAAASRCDVLPPVNQFSCVHLNALADVSLSAPYRTKSAQRSLSSIAEARSSDTTALASQRAIISAAASTSAHATAVAAAFLLAPSLSVTTSAHPNAHVGHIQQQHYGIRSAPVSTPAALRRQMAFMVRALAAHEQTSMAAHDTFTHPHSGDSGAVALAVSGTAQPSVKPRSNPRATTAGSPRQDGEADISHRLRGPPSLSPRAARAAPRTAPSSDASLARGEENLGDGGPDAGGGRRRRGRGSSVSRRGSLERVRSASPNGGMGPDVPRATGLIHSAITADHPTCANPAVPAGRVALAVATAAAQAASAAAWVTERWLGLGLGRGGGTAAPPAADKRASDGGKDSGAGDAAHPAAQAAGGGDTGEATERPQTMALLSERFTRRGSTVSGKRGDPNWAGGGGLLPAAVCWTGFVRDLELCMRDAAICIVAAILPAITTQPDTLTATATRRDAGGGFGASRRGSNIVGTRSPTQPVVLSFDSTQ